MAGKSQTRRQHGRLMVPTLVLAGLVCAWASPAMAGKNKAKAFPKFPVFAGAIEEHFDKQRDYRPGDIISQGDVKEVFRMLRGMDWVVADEDKVVADVLPDNDYMVRELRTKRGRVFMADLSKTPAAYDRLERFLRLPMSKRFFQGLLKGPDGYKMFEYMVTAKGGKVLGEQLSNAPDGHDFNKPTGHIYTVDQLLVRLEKSYTAHLAALKKAK